MTLRERCFQPNYLLAACLSQATRRGQDTSEQVSDRAGETAQKATHRAGETKDQGSTGIGDVVNKAKEVSAAHGTLVEPFAWQGRPRWTRTDFSHYLAK